MFSPFCYGNIFRNKIDSCIHNDPKKLEFKFITAGLVTFNVSFIRNARQKCINPNYPAIHISTTADHNAWLHVVFTDAQITALKMFVDSEHSIHPFYTLESDFYNAPLWTYSFFNRPLSFWNGKVFALNINHQAKTIRCLGGIEWGFKLYFLEKPTAIEPKLLSQRDWQGAWQFVNQELPGYKLIDALADIKICSVK